MLIRTTINNCFIFLTFYGCVTCIPDEPVSLEVVVGKGDASLIFKNLHKCSCLANEVWFNGVCQENATTIQVLINAHPSQTEIIETNVVKNVEVGDVICPKNYLNLTLPGESFALKTSGQLFNLNYELSLDFSKYCVEHFYDNNSQEVNLEVHLCLPISKVPECCPNNFYDAFNHVCRYENSSHVSVPFKLGNHMFETDTVSFPNVLKCQNHDNRTFVSMSQNSETAYLKLTNEGLELVHKVSLAGDMIFVPSPEYCLVVENERVIAASYCYEDLFVTHQEVCFNKTCVRKCCPIHQIYDMEAYRCIAVPQNRQWHPEFYDHLNMMSSVDSPENTKFVVGFPLNCEFFPISPTYDPPDHFKIISNGSLFIESWQTTLPPYRYCIDSFKYEQTYTEEAFVCFAEKIEEVPCQQTKNMLDPILLIISCIFLAITLVVYGIIPDLHAKVQSKCLIANVSSLLVSYIFLVVIQLGYSNLSLRSCIIFGLLTQFSMLASFFWLNVMCFDIWRTLRSTSTGRESPASARKRYLKYSLYAWGCPLVISIVTIVMQTLPIPKEESNLVLPRLGESSCFFPAHDTKALWAYLYGFISVILIANMCFFVHLAFLLLKAQKVSEMALGKRNQQHKEWAKLYLKLFLIMGITWIFEVTSWIEGSCGFWIVTDIINALRGLLIFIVFVCKRDIIRKLMKESTPTFQRMTTSMRQSSMFSRSSKRTSNFYVDPSSTTAGTNDEIKTVNEDDVDVPL